MRFAPGYTPSPTLAHLAPVDPSRPFCKVLALAPDGGTATYQPCAVEDLPLALALFAAADWCVAAAWTVLAYRGTPCARELTPC